jgi:hypothetical protein
MRAYGREADRQITGGDPDPGHQRQQTDRGPIAVELVEQVYPF